MCLYLVMKLYFVLKVMDGKNAPSTLKKKNCVSIALTRKNKNVKMAATLNVIYVIF